MQAKYVETFEFEKATAFVYYNKKPTKEDLEEACINFLKKVQEQKNKNRKGDLNDI